MSGGGAVNEKRTPTDAIEPAGLKLVGHMADIIELAEPGKRKANLYLEHGYRLLGVFVVSHAVSDESGLHMIRQLRYVVGRTKEVEFYDPPDYKPADKGSS